MSTQARAAVEPPAGRTRADRGERFLLRLAALALLLATWWAVALWIGTDIIPTPATVGERLINVVLHEEFVRHMTATVARVCIALAVSLSMATVLGIGMGLSRTAERFFDGLVPGGRVMPGLAWALIAVMVVGVSGRAPILAVTLAVTPLLTLQLWEGTKALDRDLFQMARVFEVGAGRQLRHIVVPAIMPSIMGGAKLGLALSLKVTVLAELFGVRSGVGYEINRNFQIFSLDGVLAWALSFAVIMAAIEYGLIAPLYSRLTRWRSPGAGLPMSTRLLRQSAWSKRVSDTRVSEVGT